MLARRRHTSLYWRIAPTMLGLVMLGSGAISFFTLNSFKQQVEQFDAQVIRHEAQVAGGALRKQIEDLSSKTFSLTQSATLSRMSWANPGGVGEGSAPAELQGIQPHKGLQEAVLARSPQLRQMLTIIRGLQPADSPMVIHTQRSGQGVVSTRVYPFRQYEDRLIERALTSDQHTLIYSGFERSQELIQGPHYLQSSTPFSSDEGRIWGHLVLRQAVTSLLTEIESTIQNENLLFLYHPEQGQLHHLTSGHPDGDAQTTLEHIRQLQSEQQQPALASPDSLALYDMSQELGYGGLVLGMGSVAPQRNEIVNRAITFNLELQLAVIIAFMLASLLAAKSISRPIEMLRKTLSTKREFIGDGDLSPSADADLKDLFDVIVANAEKIRTQNEDLQARLEDLTRARDELHLAYERVQSSDEQRGIFIKIIAHDLREPLLVTKSYADLIPEMLAEDDDEGLKRGLGFMTEALQRMTSLLECMRRHFAIGTAEVYSMVPVAELATEVVAQLEPKELLVDAELSIEGRATVYGNEGDIRLLLSNLIRNALLFRAPDQSCSVGISIHALDDGCRITVRDNGIGIAEQFHERIFEMFFRLHPRDRYPGYGTGLTECQMIAKLHQGEVTVQPAAGPGSCFTVRLRNLPETSVQPAIGETTLPP